MPESVAAPLVDTSDRSNRLGAAWMAFSVLTAAGMTLAVRSASGELPATVIVLQRALGGLGLCAIAALAVPALRGRLRFTAPWLHVWRGALIGVSTQMGFYTISELPLAMATVLFFSAPIFATLLSIPLQKQRVGLRRGLAIAAGFVGVLIVVRPGAAPVDLAVLSAIASSFLFALALVSSRSLGNRDGPFAAYVSSAVMTVIVSAPLGVANWTTPTLAWGWVALGLVIVFSLARNIADLQAYRYADAAVLAPLAYTRLILIALGAFLLFSETPDLFTWIGGAVIVAAALYIARRERLLKRGAPTPPA